MDLSEDLKVRFRGALHISVREAGEVLGVSTATAYRLVKNGHLTTVPVGHRQRVPLTELVRLLEEGTTRKTNESGGA